MTREYNFNNAKYALLTVTDNECIIKKYDWCMFYSDEFQNTESVIDGNKITVTIYEPSEHDEFWNVQQFLAKASDIKPIYILNEILSQKQKEVK